MGKLSCDIKYMYGTSTDRKFIPLLADEVKNYLMTITLYLETLHKVEESLINHLFYKHCPFLYLIFDEDHAFLSSVMQYIYKRLVIKMKTISPDNHGSLNTERHVRTIREMIVKQLTGRRKIMVTLFANLYL